MAEILSAIAGRFACREFSNQAVKETELEAILEAGRLAPSGFGMEPWRFIVVGGSQLKADVAAACFSQPPAESAPVLVVIVALAGALRPDTDYVQARLEAEAGGMPVPAELRAAYQDFCAQLDARGWASAQCNFAAAQMMIQATALGLATCPIGGFDDAALARALNLPAGEAPALVLALGHCAQSQGVRRRKPMSSIREDR